MEDIPEYKVKTVSKEGRIANYLIYILADMLETLIPFAERESNRAGFGFNKKHKDLITRLRIVVTDMRKVTRQISMNSQADFGETSDALLKLILLTMDRVGENENKMQMVFNFIEKINSEQNLSLNKII